MKIDVSDVLAIVQKQNHLSFSPIYDNGDAFFSDLLYFPVHLKNKSLQHRSFMGNS